VDRVFLDANVLFSAAYREESGLTRLWQIVNVELVTSSYAVREAERNLATEVQRQRLGVLLANTTIVGDAAACGLPPRLTLPEKDVPILAAAVHGGATHLLTGDKKHFGPLFGQTVDGVLIQPPAAYLADRTEGPQQDHEPA
jgi:predicted nucleic acid-binding protein